MRTRLDYPWWVYTKRYLCVQHKNDSAVAVFVYFNLYVDI